METNPGLHPALRAVVGLSLGAMLGALVGLLLPREPHHDDGRDHPISGRTDASPAA